MFKICERMNLDVENDLSHLTNTHHIKYMKTIFSQSIFNKTIRDQFSKTSDELLDIVESMLQFNPYFRPTVKELLSNRLFDSIRNS